MAVTFEAQTDAYLRDRADFLTFLREWEEDLPSVKLADVVREADGPDRMAIVCVDVVVGFCIIGRLASPRVGRIVPAVLELFKRVHSLGINSFVLLQDAHPADSLEFQAYGPHCIAGTEEAETVPELKNLPFSDRFVVIPKQSLNAGVGTRFPSWLNEHRNVRRFVVVGDCTDLCVYQTAMYLKLRANQFRLDYDVMVPADCVDTFDLPVGAARERGILPHDADLLHPLFLYHMQLNGIRVVRTLIG